MASKTAYQDEISLVWDRHLRRRNQRQNARRVDRRRQWSSADFKATVTRTKVL